MITNNYDHNVEIADHVLNKHTNFAILREGMNLKVKTVILFIRDSSI